MSAITEIKNNLIELRNGLILDLIVRIVAENLEFVEDLQTDQLEQGLDGNGNLIQPQYRNDTYARVKQVLNPKPPFGTPDLKLTGSFHRKIQAVISGRNVFITSLDSKTGDLMAKYGEFILSLNNDSVQRLGEELIFPELLTEIPKFILK